MSDPRNSDRMVSRLAPENRIPPSRTESRGGRPPFEIDIVAGDGETVLLHMTEKDGKLDVSGDESRWTEAARRFVYGMMQWSGQAGLNWRDEAEQEARGQ